MRCHRTNDLDRSRRPLHLLLLRHLVPWLYEIDEMRKRSSLLSFLDSRVLLDDELVRHLVPYCRHSHLQFRRRRLVASETSEEVVSRHHPGRCPDPCRRKRETRGKSNESVVWEEGRRWSWWFGCPSLTLSLRDRTVPWW